MSHPIKLVLKSLHGEEDLTTMVDTENEIAAFSIDYNSSEDKTIVCAFNSTAEIHREDGNVDAEEIDLTMDDLYSFYILRTPQEVQDFDNRVGDYEHV